MCTYLLVRLIGEEIGNSAIIGGGDDKRKLIELAEGIVGDETNKTTELHLYSLDGKCARITNVKWDARPGGPGAG